MEASGASITLEDIVRETSEMRLKLKKKGESLADQKLSGSSKNDLSDSDDEVEELTEKLINSLVKKTKAEIKNAQDNIIDFQGLNEKEKQEAVEKNKKRVDDSTEKTVQKLRRVGEKMKEEMAKLPLPIQPQVITFWESAQDFFSGVLDWLSSMFNYVMEKIRQGFQIVKNAIKGLFDTVCGFLGNIFKKKEQKSEEPTTESDELRKKYEQKISFWETYSRKINANLEKQRWNPMN